MNLAQCTRAAMMCNDALFRGRLPKHRIELVDITAKGLAGCYAHNHKGGYPTIRLNVDMVRNATAGDIIPRVLATIVHEQNHMQCWLSGDTGHGPVWQLKMFALGLQPIPTRNGGFIDTPIPNSPFTEAAAWIVQRLGT